MFQKKSPIKTRARDLAMLLWQPVAHSFVTFQTSCTSVMTTEQRTLFSQKNSNSYDLDTAVYTAVVVTTMYKRFFSRKTKKYTQRCVNNLFSVQSHRVFEQTCRGTIAVGDDYTRYTATRTRETTNTATCSKTITTYCLTAANGVVVVFVVILVFFYSLYAENVISTSVLCVCQKKTYKYETHRLLDKQLKMQ